MAYSVWFFVSSICHKRSAICEVRARLASGTFLIRLQDGWRRAGEFVYLKEVYPPVPDADKIQFVERDDLGEKADAKKKQEYKKLFLR